MNITECRSENGISVKLEIIMSEIKKSNVSVVIPVYNGADTVIPLTERLLHVLPEEFQSYEIIFVDDCSPDNSWNVLKDLQIKNPETIRVIHLARNFGQHNATL